MRRAFVAITGEVLAESCKPTPDGEWFRVKAGVPADAKFVGADYDAVRGELRVFFDHDSFREVQPGSPAGRLDPPVVESWKSEAGPVGPPRVQFRDVGSSHEAEHRFAPVADKDLITYEQAVAREREKADLRRTLAQEPFLFTPDMLARMSLKQMRAYLDGRPPGTTPPPPDDDCEPPLVVGAG